MLKAWSKDKASKDLFMDPVAFSLFSNWLYPSRTSGCLLLDELASGREGHKVIKVI